MDNKVMQKVSYGLYVLTSKAGGFSNGCIINTLVQVTTSPNRVSITVNKSNYTHYLVKTSGEFNVSMIDESADFSTFKHFGFSSGRWENKFYRFKSVKAENGIPYVHENTAGYISCKVVQTIDLGTHTMFIADVVDGKVLSNIPAMTYAYYHASVKPKPVAKKFVDENKPRYICRICGYIYEGELPDDFICPICKHGAEDFDRI